MMLRMTPAMLTPSMRTPSTMNSSMSLGSSVSDIKWGCICSYLCNVAVRNTLVKSEIQNSFMSPMSLRKLITYITHILSYLSVLCNQPTTNMFRTFGTSNCQAQIVKYKHCDPLKLILCILHVTRVPAVSQTFSTKKQFISLISL